MPQLRQDLVEFFHPDGVAVVGQVDRTATREKLDAAYAPRYGTRWFLVNPKGGEVDGVKVYQSLADLPELAPLMPDLDDLDDLDRPEVPEVAAVPPVAEPADGA